MPEPGPLGETLFEASRRAMVSASLSKRPASGYVLSVCTFADHRLEGGVVERRPDLVVRAFFDEDLFDGSFLGIGEAPTT
jgi:hypothetical protein